MTDLEKVIKGLECCTKGEVCISDCPYFKEFPMTDGRCITTLQADALALMKEQPEIVRCKDCKYCEYPEAEKEWCKKGHLHGNAKNWFCADGERKD